MNAVTTYEKLEKRYGENNYNRKSITGSTVGCSRCVGYCMYEGHRGYLTAELRKEHDCLGKGCYHYIEKPRREKTFKTMDKVDPFAEVKNAMSAMGDSIYSLACELSNAYEGILFTKADVSEFGKCELSYVTISNDYPLDQMASTIEEKTGYTVMMKNLNYTFDRVVEMIMNRIPA